jgi:hypothetical protein
LGPTKKIYSTPPSPKIDLSPQRHRGHRVKYFLFVGRYRQTKRIPVHAKYRFHHLSECLWGVDDSIPEGMEPMIQSSPACAKAPAGEPYLGLMPKRRMQTALVLRNFSEGGPPDWIIRKAPLCSLCLRGEPGLGRGEYQFKTLMKSTSPSRNPA